MLTNRKLLCARSALYPHTLASRQVGEIEEQLTSARRELARSEVANQKLQRDVKEVRLAELLTDNKPPLCVSVTVAQRVYFAHTHRNI